MRILVSACLLGVNCKYSGENNYSEAVIQYLKDKFFVPVCPEQLGGLPTPRPCCEMVDGRIVDEDGLDRTEAFHNGAEEALRIARLTGCTHALLQKRSPSCGLRTVYDGTFSGTLVPGSGVAARLLREAGLVLMTEEDL